MIQCDIIDQNSNMPHMPSEGCIMTSPYVYSRLPSGALSLACQPLFLYELIIAQSQRKGSGDFHQVLVDTARMLAEPIKLLNN